MSDIGLCHVCPRPRELKKVELCSACGHYFCEDCKQVTFKNVWNRGIEAVKEVVGGRRPGCCSTLRVDN